MASSQKLLELLLAVSFVSLSEKSSVTATSVSCPPNSSLSCKPPCFNTCDNLNATSCKESCVLKCHCTEGYVSKSEDSSECVPVSSCTVTCPAYMTFRDCSRTPPETCSTLGIHYVPSRTCMPRCVCNDGYVLSNEVQPRCIKKTKCPQMTLS